MDDHAVLKSMKLSWLQHLDLVGAVIIAITLLLALLGSYLDSLVLMLLFPIGIGINVFLRWFQKFYFYEFAICPKCSSKLNYFKNGNKIPSEKAWGALRQGKGCKACGWKPLA